MRKHRGRQTSKLSAIVYSASNVCAVKNDERIAESLPACNMGLFATVPMPFLHQSIVRRMCHAAC